MHENRGLRILRCGQLLNRTVPAESAQTTLEDIVGFFVQLAHAGEGAGEVLPHPDELRALPR
jgi:hypothetical protein